jgi:hypothetical protein
MEGEVQISEGDAVTGHLHPGNPQVFCELAGLDEMRVNRRLAA